MISIHLTTYAASPPETVVPKNPVPPQKEQRSMVRPVILGRNRSPARKYSANTADTRSVSGRSNTSEIARELGARVTTSHVFSVSFRRKAAFLLPISQPNADFSEGKCSRAWRGGGVKRTHPTKVLSPISSHGIFTLKGLPCPITVLLKKTRLVTCAQFRRQSWSAFSRELTANHR